MEEIKKLTFIKQNYEDDELHDIYVDENGKEYRMIYQFVCVQTKSEDGRWANTDEEWEIDG